MDKQGKIFLKGNRKKKLFICLLIVIILLIVLLLILLNTRKKSPLNVATEKLIYIQDSELWNDDTLWPDNSPAFTLAYKGDIVGKTIGKSMYYVATEVFPEYYADLKDADDEKIEKYYSKYSESIKINLAIDNQKQFTNLIHELQELSGDELAWQSYRIDVDTIKVGANYTKAVLYITYEGNSEIPINIKVKNKMSNNYSSIVYTVST